jgi:hypothetical protein
MSNIIQFNRAERMNKEEVEKRKEILSTINIKRIEQAKRNIVNERVMRLAKIKRTDRVVDDIVKKNDEEII